MRRFIATLFILAFTLSCSESPPVQQAVPSESASQVLMPETPAVEVQAESEPAKTPQSKKTSRLKVGDQAPNFRLLDQAGVERTLESLLVEGKVAMVFHRSADW